MESFEKLGLCAPLCDSIKKLGWDSPTPIQIKAIPAALNGHDILGLAEAGSGKTGAYALPIIQRLMQKPKPVFALILCPTRELAVQTVDVCNSIGQEFGLKCIGLVGGQSAEVQSRELKKTKFHIVVGTPGRIAYHITQSKSLNFSKLNYLVVDEADQFFTEMYEVELSLILEHVNPKRKTFLYSATACSGLEKLENFGMTNPCRIEVSADYSKAERLDHAFIFLPDEARDLQVITLLQQSGVAKGTHKAIVFCNNWRDAVRLADVFNQLVFQLESDEHRSVLCMHGKMRQAERHDVLDEFKKGRISVVVATDLAARGLDIPQVDLVVNFDLPFKSTWEDTSKAYVHRIGRSGRAGRAGRSISLVTPYTVANLKIIESMMGEKVPQLQWQPQLSEEAESLTKRIKLISGESKLQLKDDQTASKKRTKKMPKKDGKRKKK